MYRRKEEREKQCRNYIEEKGKGKKGRKTRQ